jgi:deazaflavin-dependent oxidoreductase (nitroreductase family)
MTDQDTRRPSRLLKAVFDAPGWLYRHRMGWLLGKRFLAVTHLGRRSGIERRTVLEVAVYDKDRRESIVASAYGEKADWYRNIQAHPAVKVETGRGAYVPEQRFLSRDEARTAAATFCRRHRLEARMAARALASIGAVPEGAFEDPVDLLASLPMVAFRPGDAHPARSSG